MKYFFFKQKRDKVQDPRIFGRKLRDFKVQAETELAAIKKYSNASQPTLEKSSQSENIIPVKLTEKDIVELYDICDYNYALHRDVEELDTLKG